MGCCCYYSKSNNNSKQSNQSTWIFCQIVSIHPIWLYFRSSLLVGRSVVRTIFFQFYKTNFPKSSTANWKLWCGRGRESGRKKYIRMSMKVAQQHCIIHVLTASLRLSDWHFSHSRMFRCENDCIRVLIDYFPQIYYTMAYARSTHWTVVRARFTRPFNTLRTIQQCAIDKRNFFHSFFCKR